MRGKITERWFAEKEGIFSLITRALLVIEGMITWCWLAEHACIKLVSRLKRNSETHRFWAWSKHGCFNLTWKKMNMEQSAVFRWKSKRIFPVKNVLIHSLKIVWVRTAGAARSLELSPGQTESQVDASWNLGLLVTPFGQSKQVFHRLTTQAKSTQVEWRPLAYH